MQEHDVRTALTGMLLGFEKQRGGTLVFCGARRTKGSYATTKVTLRDSRGNRLHAEFRILVSSRVGTTLSVQSASCRSLNPLDNTSGSFKWAAEPRRQRYEQLNQDFKSHLQAVLGSHNVIEKSILPFWKRWLRLW